jgi:hypothetical protein
MNARCSNPRHKAFANYGGRGITVSKEWRDPLNFFNDMGPRPEGFTLERRDNNLGYSRENCYWADRKTQNMNKRMYRNNTTGVRGVTVRGTGGYRVQIRLLGGEHFDYSTSDFFEACCAAISARNHPAEQS